MSSPARRRLAPAALACFGVLLPLVFAQEEGRRYALVIGVNTYKKDQFRQLRFAEKDADALAGAFTTAGYHRVVRMTYGAAKGNFDHLPTARNIRGELQALLKDRREADTVVVAFSGHGVEYEDGEHYFCPTDADLTDRDTLVSLKQVYADLKACKARVKLLMVDACRNNPLAAKRSKDLDKVQLESRSRPQKVDVPGGVAALFSCSLNQLSYESDEYEHGIFFHYVLEGLAGKAKNKRGAVDLVSLVKHVKDEVPDAAMKENGRLAVQTPELRGEVADMVLVPPGREAVTKLEKEFTVVGMKMVRIPGGTFTMGSPADEKERSKDEGPQHEVEVGEFYLGAYEVTQGQYEEVMGKNPSYFSASGGGKDEVSGKDTSDYPVETVSWEEAKAFCEKLNEKADKKRPSGWAYRLPREAEWEYSCRGGASSYATFHFGNSLSSAQANFDGNYPYGGAEKGEYLKRTTKVGSHKANAFGVYDLHGNVWEWCADWYADGYYASSPKRDPAGPLRGSGRVLRGGSWYYDGRSCRSAFRSRRSPGHRSDNIGFRVALVPSGRAGMPE